MSIPELPACHPAYNKDTKGKYFLLLPSPFVVEEILVQRLNGHDSFLPLETGRLMGDRGEVHVMYCRSGNP